tara:strand:+ start:122 stop:433 length:312 start_codon:yes stop_codon:yes gene_type:complete
MGKIKKLLDFEVDFQLDEDELNAELYSRNDYDYQYEEWKKSPDFVEHVNMEIEKTKPVYSKSDVKAALKYASEHITIEPSEVGKEVYNVLFSEKVEEYLSLKK